MDRFSQFTCPTFQLPFARPVTGLVIGLLSVSSLALLFHCDIGHAVEPNDQRVVLTLKVPAGADVLINGQLTKGSGPVRRLVDRNMIPGRLYQYRVRVILRRDGKQYGIRKTLNLYAGQRRTLSFSVAGDQPKNAKPGDLKNDRDNNNPPQNIDVAIVPPVPEKKDLPQKPKTSSAELTLVVPADAEVLVDAQPVNQIGSRRVFSLSNLLAGRQEAVVTLQVSIRRAGRKLIKLQSVQLSLDGESRELKFDFSSELVRILAARHSDYRTEMLRREGGDKLTEAKVESALAWMVRRQRPEGFWAFNQSDSAETNRGKGNHVLATSVALLPLLGSGQSHQRGRPQQDDYQQEIAGGIGWLVNQQRADGALLGSRYSDRAMQAHALATIVLCEALGMTGDEELRTQAQNSVNYLMSMQQEDGVWLARMVDPKSTEEDLKSVPRELFWQAMALRTAQLAGLEVDQEIWNRLGKYLDSVQSEDGARYAIGPDQPADEQTTAAALLCRIWLGWKADHPALRTGIAYLLSAQKTTAHSINFEYRFVGTLLMHQVGGKPWQTWNEKTKALLALSAVQQGPDSGSWSQRTKSDEKLLATALAAGTLEVYYRQTSALRPIELPEVKRKNVAAKRRP